METQLKRTNHPRYIQSGLHFLLVSGAFGPQCGLRRETRDRLDIPPSVAESKSSRWWRKGNATGPVSSSVIYECGSEEEQETLFTMKSLLSITQERSKVGC